jgi:hypothetical protein
MQYLSDLTSYLFLRAMIQAVDEIVLDPQGAAKKWPVEPLTTGSLPPVAFRRERNPDMHDLASLSEDPPGCYTLQKSTFGKSQPVIADRNEDGLNPYKDSVKKLSSSADAWSVWNAPPNWKMVPRDERSMGDMCKPPDNCAYFVEPTSGVSTPLVFRLPKMTTGLIALCFGTVDAGKKMMENRTKFVAEFDGKKMDSNLFTVFPDPKCMALQKKFTGTVENKHGHLYLSIVTTIPLQISQILTA